MEAGKIKLRRGGMKDRRDAGQWTGGMLDRWDAGQERCWTGQMLDRRDAGQKRCWTEEMLDRKDAGQEGCRTGEKRLQKYFILYFKLCHKTKTKQSVFSGSNNKTKQMKLIFRTDFLSKQNVSF